MDALTIGKAGLAGWRAKLADQVAQPLARHSPLTDEQVRAAVGAVFFGLALVYVVGTVRRAVAQA